MPLEWQERPLKVTVQPLPDGLRMMNQMFAVQSWGASFDFPEMSEAGISLAQDRPIHLQDFG
jgi:hypothetical protein